MIKYEIRKHFADYVTQKMTERNLHPWYVAYYCETSESFLRQCVKMKNLPRIDSLIMIAELFECSINDLLGFEPVEVPSRSNIFDSGLDSKRVAEYFIDQITLRGFDLDIFQFDDSSKDADFKRCIMLYKLPDTDSFLQICAGLNCTPSELLGY